MPNTPAPGIDAIRDWFFAERPRALTDDQAVEAFHLLGPRCRFFKTLAPGSNVLDVGAGEGALHVYRDWPLFRRPDLKIFAYAGERGANFHRYDAYEIGLWPEAPPDFGGMKFDAIEACNFIEHIDGPLEFLRWCARRLSPCGRLYLEWPRPQSAALPTRPELLACGIDVMTGNYFDDATHRAEMPRSEDVLRELAAMGLEIEASGIASVPFVDAELASAALAGGDVVSATMAYWSYTGWCQYVVARN